MCASQLLFKYIFTPGLQNKLPEIFSLLRTLRGKQTGLQYLEVVFRYPTSGVISEWPLKIQDGDQEKSVTGLYRIDEEKLNTLEDEKFLKIRKAGALPIAYAQLFSMGNIQNFAQLAKTHEQLKTKTPDIQPILGDDDIISFQ